MQINDNIKKARELKGYSQAKIAELLGEKRSTYAEWERSTVPKADVLAKISQITGVTMSDLLDEKPAINGRQKPTDPLTGAHVTLQDYIDKQEQRIAELKRDKDMLYALLNSNLVSLKEGQQIMIAYQKAWVDYAAELESKGDPDKKAEISYKMNKLVDDILMGEVLSGNQTGSGRQHKG